MTSKTPDLTQTSNREPLTVGGLDVPPFVWKEGQGGSAQVARFHQLLDVQRQWLSDHPPQRWTEAHVVALTTWFETIRETPPTHPVNYHALENALKREWVLQWVDAVLDDRKPNVDSKNDWRAQKAIWKPLLRLWEGTFEDVLDPQSKISWMKSVVIRGDEHHVEFSAHEMRRMAHLEWKKAMQSYAGKNPQFVSTLAILQRGRVEGLLLPDPSGVLETPSNVALVSAWCDGVFEGAKSTTYADAKFAFLKQMSMLSGFSHWVDKNPSVLEEGRNLSPVNWTALWLKNESIDPEDSTLSEGGKAEAVLGVHAVVETVQAMLDILGNPKHPDDPWGVQKEVAKNVWGSVQAAIDHATRQKARLERAMLRDRVNPMTEVAVRPAL
jgi:hypothetical protein